MAIAEEYALLTSMDSKLQAGAINTIIEDVLFHVYQEYTFSRENCINLAVYSSPASVGKLLIDSRYATQTQQDKFLEQVNKYIQAVKWAFKSMINQVSWMNEKSKRLIYQKLDKMKVCLFITTFNYYADLY